MTFSQRVRIHHPAVWLLIACLLLAISSYLIVQHAVADFVSKDAELRAGTWGKYIADNLPDLEEIAAGQPLSTENRMFVAKSSSIDDILLFKIFDQEGYLRLVSDEIDQPHGIVDSLAQHNPTAANVVKTGLPYTIVKEGTPPERPSLYAETYLPAIRDGRTIAIIEVYVDETERAAHARSHFTVAALLLMAITGVSFGVPATGFYLRHRQKMRADANLHFLANHDAMTALMNRASLTETLSKRLASDGQAAVLYIDVDRFKEVNDTLGHDVGDELVGAVAGRLLSLARDNDLVARMGGDEFAIVRFDAAQPERVEEFADSVIRALQDPIATKSHVITTTLSIGIAVAPMHGRTITELFKCADVALYKAKADGRNRYRVFTSEMNDELDHRLNLEKTIRNALAQDKFDLHFQAFYAVDDSRLMGFEALLRLRDAEDRFIPTSLVIPVAEEMGLISQIGDWVLQRACSIASNWPDHLKVAINLSPQQFDGDGVVDPVSSALAASGLNPSQLELEITEGLMMKNTESVIGQLKSLKELGVSIVMDDFGTGYSSLNYLWRFPFDKIKIDRSFFEIDSGKDLGKSSVLRAIMSLGRSLDIEVTAEGIETMDHVDTLRSLACHHMQGFLFGEPMPESELAIPILNSFAARKSPHHELPSAAIRPSQSGPAG